MEKIFFIRKSWKSLKTAKKFSDFSVSYQAEPPSWSVISLPTNVIKGPSHSAALGLYVTYDDG